VTVGIYQIRNTVNGRRYVGKSVNIEQRFIDHRCSLTRQVRKKDTNRYLWRSVKKHGLSSFSFEVLEVLHDCTDAELSDRELFWMDKFNTCDREFGYNLRRDSSTKTTVHSETRRLLSEVTKGVLNGNYVRGWDQYMKTEVGEKVKLAHAAGRYGNAWREKIGVAASLRYAKMTAAERNEHGRLTSLGRQAAYDFGQYNLDGTLIAVWNSVEVILQQNPMYKWQNIYAACNGNKPTAYGFMWRRAPTGAVAEVISPVFRKPMGRKIKTIT